MISNHRSHLTIGRIATISLWFAATISFSLLASQRANPGYYRYPFLQAKQLVFTAESDWWLAQLGHSNITPEKSSSRSAILSSEGSAATLGAV